MAGCLVSIFAPTFEAMLAGRVLQGLGVAGPRIVIMALIRDLYAGPRMARLMSFVMAVFILVPAVAPALGQGILWLSGWRTIFATFFATRRLRLRMARAAPAGDPARRPPAALLAAGHRPGRAGEFLGIRAAVGYTLATGFAFSPFVAYLSSAQQIFQEAYRVGALFPLYFGVLARSPSVSPRS